MQAARFTIYGLFAATSVLITDLACAQAFPSKPIRIITSEPGSGSDFAARIIAQGIALPLGQQVIIDNRGAGVVAIMPVVKSAPDGYTLLLFGSTVWLLPFLQENVPYDPARDLAPISWAASAPNILVVNPSLPVTSVKQLITLAKTHPGALNYGSGGLGSSPHLAAELFKALASVNIVRISYRGGGPALTDLISGHLQVMFPAAGSVMPHIKSGRLKALAVTSAQPSRLLPALPTIAAAGVAGYESVAMTGIFAPAKTSPAVISRLNREITEVLSTVEVKEKFFNAGVEVIASSPEQLADTMKSEMVRMGKVIKDAGIRSE